MSITKLNSRLAIAYSIVIQFLIVSFIVRLVIYFWSFSNIVFSFYSLIKVLFTGLFFDIGTISFFLVIYLIYVFLFPNKWVGSLFDKIFSYTFFFLIILILSFSFFAEFTFWEEFQSRFNFIAVDYLVYSYEVIENINQSYPIPLLLAIIFGLVYFQYYIIKKLNVFKSAFSSKVALTQRVIIVVALIIPVFFTLFINNTDAEWSKNRYENEISKAGIYSFFAAFRNNELSYTEFYNTQDIDESFELLKDKLKTNNDTLFSEEKYNISRYIKAHNPKIKPNVIFICMESFGTEFIGHFGNEDSISPNFDSLIGQSISFENMYATGTRTIRGMEAILLSIPPSPGRSIVKREENSGFYNIGDVFEEQGYSRTFFYGGDGYFDNMNHFFGGNGFDIVDRGRGYLFDDSFTAKRTNIEDNEVQFENAWGTCDEDIYNKVIKEADLSYASNKPFFNFVMTISNHRPFTYPDNKVDIPSGDDRKGAVKYTDYAVGKFIENVKKKPWFKNTVIVFMADHCSSSAGRRELNVGKYHIPTIIYNLPNDSIGVIENQASQIDLFPTLFGYFGWEYRSNFYGEDVNTMKISDQRAFISNYRKLGLLKGESLTVLGDQKKTSYYNYNKETNLLTPVAENKTLYKEIVSYYQTNDFRYKNYLMKYKN